MKAFLEEQADLPTEYDEQIVQRLIERVAVFDEKITVRFKSGVEISAEKEDEYGNALQVQVELTGRSSDV